MMQWGSLLESSRLCGMAYAASRLCPLTHNGLRLVGPRTFLLHYSPQQGALLHVMIILVRVTSCRSESALSESMSWNLGAKSVSMFLCMRL